MFNSFIKIPKKIWKKPIEKGIILGRWNTVISDDEINIEKKNKYIEFNIDNANHDHCGSELCNKEIKKSDYQRFKFIYDDEHYPYII